MMVRINHVAFLVPSLPADFAYDLVPYLADQTSTRLSVSLTSGLVAGVCAAIVSQPGGIVWLGSLCPASSGLAVPLGIMIS